MAQQLDITPHPGYKASAGYWTRILSGLFSLPRLGAFPALSQLPSTEEAEVIDRFLFQTLRLMESEGLNGASGVRNRWTREEGWTVESNFPQYEALTGFAAHFRQLYSTSERGSFYAVMRILRRLSQDGSVDEAKRVEMLRIWSDAIGALRSKGTLRLAEEKLGVVRPGDPVDLRPEALIRVFINGELLHWQQEHASSLSARTPSPEFEANLRYKYHESVAPVAYLFICFAYFVNELLRRSVTQLNAV